MHEHRLRFEDLTRLNPAKARLNPGLSYLVLRA
jgi:hypothetical protein